MAKLTIGMLTFDDFHGVYFTLQAIRMYHKEVLDQIEMLVIDNNPDGPHGQEVRNLINGLPNTHYSAVRGKSSSTLKNLIFELSNTEYTMCMDCHVLLEQGSLAKLLQFYEAYPACDDLLQGPLLAENGDVIATEMMPAFRGQNFGIWHTEEQGKIATNNAYEIAMHGMGMFVCRTTAWPRFTSGTNGFGSEEGVLHEKFRLLGRKCYCLPFLRWVHRFGRPDGVKYPILAKDKVRNLVLAFREMQLPLEIIDQYWQDKLQPANLEESRRLMSDLLFWAESLPPSPFMQRSSPPFLGKPIQLLD